MTPAIPRCLILSIWVIAGCSAEAAKGYRVHIRVIGTQVAFAGRSMTIQGETFPPPTLEPTEQFPPDPVELMASEVTLCTDEREAFLSEPLVVTVQEGDATLHVYKLERPACQLATTEVGESERTQVILRDDGTIWGEFGEDRKIQTSCELPQPFFVECEKIHF